jgi:hypothetical protein
MADPDPARRRWLTLVLVRLGGSAGAVFGLVLTGRAHRLGPQLLGAAIVLSALLMIAVVPRQLARGWRSR